MNTVLAIVRHTAGTFPAAPTHFPVLVMAGTGNAFAAFLQYDRVLA
ncbi:MAG: hypothetical protein WCL44_00305 [bacterium]